mmetsp:Transcript_60252/g.127621  ORF Transcript_60252/g.127621 Transcript_60252/m.127621 type:complete len:194 (+) Transcript_60252:89-670(+)
MRHLDGKADFPSRPEVDTGYFPSTSSSGSLVPPALRRLQRATVATSFLSTRQSDEHGIDGVSDLNVAWSAIPPPTECGIPCWAGTHEHHETSFMSMCKSGGDAVLMPFSIKWSGEWRTMKDITYYASLPAVSSVEMLGGVTSFIVGAVLSPLPFYIDRKMQEAEDKRRAKEMKEEEKEAREDALEEEAEGSDI